MIIKMHVYTLVKLKSHWIGFLIVRLRPLEYSIDSRIYLDLDFVFCTCLRSFPGAVSWK